jgi:hypothetical protein
MDKNEELNSELPIKELNELSAHKLTNICNKKVRSFENTLIVWYVLEDIFTGVIRLSKENQLSLSEESEVFSPLLEPINNIFSSIITGKNESELYPQLNLLIKKYVTIELKLPR